MNPFDSSLATVKRLRQSRWLFPAFAVLLAACAATEPTRPEQTKPVCTSDNLSQPCVCEREPGSQLCACLTNPPAEGCGCLINPDQPECKVACPQADARTHTKEALILADAGEWDEARARIRCALEVNPNSRRALKVASEFEPGYFEANFPPVSVMYTVQPGDTLGSIARQCLDDTDLFLALARANGIDRPASLNPGVQLKIPGTQSCAAKPVAAPANPLDEALQAEQRGDYESAHDWVSEALSKSPDNAAVAAASARIKTGYIGQLRDDAYAFQDGGRPAEALGLWKQILSLDPQNKEALLNISVLDPKRRN